MQFQPQLMIAATEQQKRLCVSKTQRRMRRYHNTKFFEARREELTVGRKIFALMLVLLFSFLLLATMSNPIAAFPIQSAASCASAEYHQFDFWLGDWDVFEFAGSAKVAHVRVERVLDGCALRELYEDDTGLKGESLSIYDSSRGLWHQSWFTNRGQLLVIEGEFREGEMVLKGTDHTSAGKERLVRGAWRAVKG